MKLIMFSFLSFLATSTYAEDKLAEPFKNIFYDNIGTIIIVIMVILACLLIKSRN